MTPRGILLALVLHGGAAAAYAQESSLLGLTIGGGVAPSVVATEGNSGWGLGASARVAYGVHPVVQLFGQVRYTAAETEGLVVRDTWRIWSLEAGLRLHLLTDRAWAPYLEVGGARRTGSIHAVGPLGGPPRDWDLEGSAFLLGAGASLFVGEAVSVDVGATMNRGWLPNPRDDDPVFTHTVALLVGLSWWP